MTDVPAEPAGGIELAPGIRVAESAVRLQYSRSGGPGGQNVNKVNTKAELWISLAALAALSPSALDRLRQMAGKRITKADELHIVSETHRTAEANRLAVFERVEQMLRTARIEPKKRRKTKPSKASKRRRLEGKKRRSEIKAGRSGRHE